ncbi:class F sortase (plasmid) [Coraliomargarita sp. W4R53]
MITGTPREQPRSIRSSLVGSAFALALAVCLVSCSTPPATSVAETTATPSAAVPTAVLDVPVSSSKPVAAEAVVAPLRLEIDAIGVNMPIVPVGVDQNSQMELPVDPAIGGWYRFGADAAVDAGNMVLAAHVDAPDYPIGPLADLREVREGETVTVTNDAGDAVDYLVESVTYYPKTELPTDEIFSRDGEPALVIITCGGPFDSSSGHYRDNVVAVATPA